jgi:hypothetical protein
MSAVDLSAMMTEDQFLEHAGVKGMKWGKRKAVSPAKEARKADIDRARERFNSGEARRDYKLAKADYKAATSSAKAKYSKSKELAAAAFDKVKQKNIKDGELAGQYKDGKEAVAGTITAIAATALGAYLAVNLVTAISG